MIEQFLELPRVDTLLGPKELEVVAYLPEGDNRFEIAKKLKKSHYTVKAQLNSAYKKTGSTKEHLAIRFDIDFPPEETLIHEAHRKWLLLNVRRKAIVEKLAQGESLEDISNDLSIAVETIKTNLGPIAERFEVRNRRATLAVLGNRALRLMEEKQIGERFKLPKITDTSFSSDELRIVQSIREGDSLEAIASQLEVSTTALDRYLKGIYDEIGSKDYVELALWYDNQSDIEAEELRATNELVKSLCPIHQHVLRLLSIGYTSEFIARRKGIQPITVEGYMEEIAQMTGVRNNRLTLSLLANRLGRWADDSSASFPESFTRHTELGRELATIVIDTGWFSSKNRLKGVDERLLPPEIMIVNLIRKGLRDDEIAVILNTNTSIIAGIIEEVRQKTDLVTRTELALSCGRLYPFPKRQLRMVREAVRGLSDSERQLLGLLARGVEDRKVIAANLGISPTAAENRQSEIAVKLGVSNRQTLLAVIGRTVMGPGTVQRQSDAAPEINTLIQLTAHDVRLLNFISDGNSFQQTVSRFSIEEEALQESITEITKKTGLSLINSCVLWDALRPLTKSELLHSYSLVSSLTPSEKRLATIFASGMANELLARGLETDIGNIERRRRIIMSRLESKNSPVALAIHLSRARMFSAQLAEKTSRESSPDRDLIAAFLLGFMMGTRASNHDNTH